MNTFRPLSTPAASRPGPLFFALLLLAFTTGWLSPASAQDTIGIYWDTEYTQDSIETTAFPELLTGYLVLKDPSAAAGILGWECCVDLEGPAQFLSWSLEGQHINAASPPCFKVGLGGPPLPSSDNVLLATFQILVNEPVPVSLSLVPDYHASVPGEMSYIPADNPGSLRVLNTPTGDPKVAWINGHIPTFVVSHTTLHFDNTPIGSTNTRYFSISNEGQLAGSLDIHLAGGCDPAYALPGVNGPTTIEAGQSVNVQVTFTPTSTEYLVCNVILGGGLDEIQMIGNGHLGDVGWEAPTLVDFGTVGVGSFAIQSVRIRNTGNTSFQIYPSIPASCPEFALNSDSYTTTLSPGGEISYSVIFRPTATGPYQCQLDLGNIVPSVQLVGEGREPTYDWTLNPDSLDFGSVGIGQSRDLFFFIHNTGDLTIPVVPSVPGSCPEFTIINGGAPVQLVPGNLTAIEVRYSPVDLGQDFCGLDLGTVVSPLPMSGSGHEAVLAWEAPTSHDFGAVPVGDPGTYTFQVRNTGDVPFEVSPSLPPDTTQFELVQGPTVTLQTGMSTEIRLMFRPLVPGPAATSLNLGSTVPPVALQGTGEESPPSWVVSPGAIDFGWIYVGTYREQSLSIINTGGTFLDMDIHLDDPGLGFSVVSGGGTFQMPPGSSHEVLVRFQPLEDGTFSTELNIGGDIPMVPLTGSAETTNDICVFQPESLIFGPLLPGASQTKTVAVTNTGNQSLQLWPGTNSSRFVYQGGARVLGPSQTAYFSIVFQSGNPGVFEAEFSLGTDVCSTIPLVGTVVSGGWGGNQNLVGIFFDPSFSFIEATTYGFNEIVVGYLVLREPSETTGVSAWELKADIDGNATWLSWNLEGQTINVGEGNEFIVGIGGDPLPPSRNILLATFQIFIPEPYPNIVYLELGPVFRPSLPGQMVWAPGHDSSQLMPMFTLTGQPVVAGINWGPVVGIGNPAPRARLTGAAVELEWPVPEGTNEGCHVYRRDDAGGDFRLTDKPLVGTGAILNFTDRPSGYASGAVLHYSYSVVKSGVEGVRSPETEIRLAGMPMVRTRLLPNVPNPFNPQTEIRFELEKAQQVKVAVYDVTGRLVKTLAEGQLGSGPHARIWQGRDTGGRQVPSGAYYVRLIVQGKVDHQKIMLLK